MFCCVLSLVILLGVLAIDVKVEHGANGELGASAEMEASAADLAALSKTSPEMMERYFRCHVCIAMVEEVSGRLQRLLTTSQRKGATPVSESIGEGCTEALFERYDFPPPIAAETCQEWTDEAGDDLLESVLSGAAKAVSKLPQAQRVLNVTALKEEVCFIRSEVCQELPLVNATFSPPLERDQLAAVEEAKRKGEL